MKRTGVLPAAFRREGAALLLSRDWMGEGLEEVQRFGAFQFAADFPSVAAYSGVTGIFALPRDPLSLDDPSSSSSSDPSSSGRIQVDGISALGPTGIPSPGPSPLPDARYLASYFLGYAGPEESASASAGTSVDAGNVAGKGERRSGRWAAPQWGPAAFCEPGIRSPSMWSFGAKKKGKDNTRSWSWGTKTKSNSDTGAIRIEQPSQASKGEDLPSLISPSKRVHPRHSGARARSLTFVLKTLQEVSVRGECHC